MTFTYNPELPTRRDKVRFHAGDVDADRPGLSDEEMDIIVAGEGNDLLAAANCRDAILARWMHRTELSDRRSLGDHEQEIDLEHGPDTYREETSRLRLRGLNLAGVMTTRII